MATRSHNSLADANPEVALLWHPCKNADLKPSDVAPKSRTVVWWLCDKKHEWQSPVSNLARGRRCPFYASKRIAFETSFAALHPAAASLWHPNHNPGLLPQSVAPKSNRVVWWLCEKGHKWQAKIEHLSRGLGCPYCSGRRVTANNNLAAQMPDVARRWHPTMNGTLKPTDVVPGSDRKIWWLCDKGHTWQARIANVSKQRGTGCKLCQAEANSERIRKRGVHNTGSLAATFPEIASEWHPTRNGKWTPQDVSPKSGKRAWWKCHRGHEWATRVIQRTKEGTGCPECRPQTSKLEIRLLCELRALFPHVEWRKRINGRECDILLSDYRIVVELDGYPWHDKKHSRDTEKNALLTRLGLTVLRVRDERLGRIQNSDVLFSPRANSQEITTALVSQLLHLLPAKATERSACGDYLKAARLVADDEYRKIIALLPGPMPEDSLASLRPEVALQWHPTRNHPLEPRMFTLGSNKKIWWRCAESHEWQATVAERTKGRGCPVCSRKSRGQTYRRLAVSRKGSLAQTNPALASEWHPTKNGTLTPHDRAAGSHDKAWWRCSLGHEWRASITSRNRGYGCPFCFRRALKTSGSLAAMNPALAAEWHPTRNSPLTASDRSAGSEDKVWWICSRGHEWQARIDSRSGGGRCPFCSGKKVGADNNLAVLYPEVALLWHPTKNGPIGASSVAPKSMKKVWWLCPRGHEWVAAIGHVTRGSRCPACVGKTPKHKT